MINLLFLLLNNPVFSLNKFYLDSHSASSFGDFSLGKGFDINRFETLDTHVFRENADTLLYDLMPITNTKTRCALVNSAKDLTDKLDIRGQVSVKYKMISGSGFVQFDRDQETMRKVLYFTCTVDRTLFTASVNAPEITSDMSPEEKALFLPAHLAMINDPDQLRGEIGEYHVNSITYGRRYSTEVTVTYTNDQSYDRIAGEIEAKVGIGFLSVSAKINVEMEKEKSSEDLEMTVFSEAFGFVEPEPLVFATTNDEQGRTPVEQIESIIATNLEEFNKLDPNAPPAQTGLDKAALFDSVGDAYPLHYTVAENRPYYEALVKITARQQLELTRNLDEAYDILRELEDIYVDTEIRAESLFDNYHLLSGSTPLSLVFLNFRQKLLEKIPSLKAEVGQYLDLTPIDIAKWSVYAWARAGDKELNNLSLDLLRTDMYSLMGLEDMSMNDENPVGTTCLFNGIAATVGDKRYKFAGRVIFGEEVVRHVLFDINETVVSLGFIDHTDKVNYTGTPHELVFVREDCTLLREGSAVWFNKARYTISRIGSAEHKTADGLVNKNKLLNIHVHLMPLSGSVVVVLTGDDIGSVHLRGANSNTYGFTQDDQGRLMYQNGYVCDADFGLNEAKMICSDLGYSRLKTFETDFDIPSKNAWGRPMVTMFFLHCPEFAMALGDCSHETNEGYINWERCSAKHGIQLICTDDTMSPDEAQVEIRSQNGHGSILDETTIDERISTAKHCLGGEYDSTPFNGVQNTVVVGKVCLKTYVNVLGANVLQCVVSEGEHDLNNPFHAEKYCYNDFSPSFFPEELEVIAQGDYKIKMTAESLTANAFGELIPVMAVIELDDGQTHSIEFTEATTLEFPGDYRCGSRFQLRVSNEVSICTLAMISGRIDENGHGLVDGNLEGTFSCELTQTLSPTHCPAVCSACQTGGDGGIAIVNGKCLHWCSELHYCGTSEAYQTGGTDCSGCANSWTQIGSGTRCTTTDLEENKWGVGSVAECQGLCEAKSGCKNIYFAPGALYACVLLDCTAWTSDSNNLAEAWEISN